MREMKSFLVLASAVVTLSVVACGGTRPPPQELVSARVELGRAKQGPAAQLDPTDIHEAELALNRAEKAFADNPESPVTVDLAAIAQLRAQIAESIGATMQASNQAAQAQRDLQDTQAAQLQNARGQLQQTQGVLSKTREQLEREKLETAAERTK